MIDREKLRDELADRILAIIDQHQHASEPAADRKNCEHDFQAIDCQTHTVLCCKKCDGFTTDAMHKRAEAAERERDEARATTKAVLAARDQERNENVEVMLERDQLRTELEAMTKARDVAIASRNRSRVQLAARILNCVCDCDGVDETIDKFTRLLAEAQK